MDTPLTTRVEHLLVEARIMIPGAQALLGFQLTVMLTSGFAELNGSLKIAHAIALALVAFNMMLLMTPAALHRLTFGGHESERFVRIGSRIVIIAPLFLAAGISTDLYVVFSKVLSGQATSAFASAASFVAALAFWYCPPAFLRIKNQRDRRV